jgi:hypothetical protein
MRLPAGFLMLSFLLIILVIRTGSSTVQAKTPEVPYVKNSTVVADGIIGPNEYGGHFTDNATGISVYWEQNGTYIRIGLISPGSGWVSIGLGPRKVKMDGANIILGYMNGSNLMLFDEIGVGHNHIPDVQRGGTDNIINKAGNLKNGKLQLEFTIPMNSGDPLDQSFQPNGTYGFFLGYQEVAQDRTTYHTAHSQTYDLFIQPITKIIPPSPPTPTFPWNYALGGLASVFVVIAVVRYMTRPKVIRFKKKKTSAE